MDSSNHHAVADWPPLLEPSPLALDSQSLQGETRLSPFGVIFFLFSGRS